MSEMRRRHSTTNPTTMSGEEMDHCAPGAGLSAGRMINASPQHHGSVMKLHVPVFYSILPAFVQRFILSLPFLGSFAPSWKERHLVLCGAYLYKFKDPHSAVPKGSPFEIEMLTTDVGHDTSMNFPEMGNMPVGYEGFFTVATLRRQHFYAVSNSEEARLWVRSLHEAKQERITRNMGHASHLPYPASWKHFDALGKGLVKSKARIKDRMEKSTLRNLEMASFTDGPLPRGYHG
mmetsp:Transcript_17268/g.37799  ORF Transcript_17268/g.37799 Transcript_17268/m.37799 type:complete len:234 (+) Transcript_17268:216-917(+)